jgi:hypothetical protein
MYVITRWVVGADDLLVWTGVEKDVMSGWDELEWCVVRLPKHTHVLKSKRVALRGFGVLVVGIPPKHIIAPRSLLLMPTPPFSLP